MVAVTRHGEYFQKGEEVMMVDNPIIYGTMLNRVLVIEDIKIHDACESGFNVLLKDKESGKVFNKWLDTNWIQKLKQ